MKWMECDWLNGRKLIEIEGAIYRDTHCAPIIFFFDQIQILSVSGCSLRIVDVLTTVAKEGRNFLASQLMIDIMKVFQNMCVVEMNAQWIASFVFSFFFDWTASVCVCCFWSPGNWMVAVLKGIEAQQSN